MRFGSRQIETNQMIGNVCLILSLGAIFIQIWILMSATESYLEGKTDYILGALILSGLALACCTLTAATTLYYFGSAKKHRHTP